jgi:hypothetical protein
VTFLGYLELAPGETITLRRRLALDDDKKYSLQIFHTSEGAGFVEFSVGEVAQPFVSNKISPPGPVAATSYATKIEFKLGVGDDLTLRNPNNDHPVAIGLAVLAG